MNRRVRLPRELARAIASAAVFASPLSCAAIAGIERFDDKLASLDSGATTDGSLGAPLDATAVKRGSGGVTILQQTSAEKTYRAEIFAGFSSNAAPPECRMLPSAVAECALYACGKETNVISAGAISVTGIRTAAHLDPRADNSYDDVVLDASSSPVFVPGAELTLTGAGGTFPSFELRAIAPPPLASVSTSVQPALAITGDLDLAWTPVPGTDPSVDVVFAGLNSNTGEVIALNCVFAKRTSATLPSALLQVLGPSGSFRIGSSNSVSMDVNGFTVSLKAIDSTSEGTFSLAK
jgi:hypothetical protein